jgi:hypothetical protein
MTKFTSSTDRQLWVHEEEDFCQPLWAVGGEVDGKPHWLVNLPYTQYIPRDVRDKVTAHLYHGSITKDPFNLILPDQYLREYASPRYGTTPSYFQRYKSVNQPKPVTMELEAKPRVEDIEKQEAREVSDERFLKMAWKMSPIADYKVFRMVWLAICQAMPHRLLVDMIPIDFGWARIHAFPYRKNWRQIILSRMPNCHEQLQKAEGKTLYQKALATDLPMHMRNSVLIALDKDEATKHKFGWTLEIEESQEFDKWAHDLEVKRHQSITRKEYASQWASIINKQATDIIKVFHRFVRQTVIPAAQLGKGTTQSGGGLVPLLASRGVREARVDNVPVDPVTPTTAELCDDSGRRVVVGKAKKLPPMPVLRAVPSYMRKSGGGDSRLEWAGPDENRMLVLGADGSVRQTQDVLAQVVGGDDGLERVVAQGDVTVIKDGRASKS